MRSPVWIFFVLCLATPALGEASLPLPSRPGLSAPDAAPSGGFRLGGALSKATVAPATAAPAPAPTRLRLSVPQLIRETGKTLQRTTFGGISLYFGEAWDQGEDVFQLGTALTRGQSTAGISLTYTDSDRAVTASELYFDYAVTDRFSVGVSGIFNEDVTSGDDQVPQLGLSAALNAANGTYLQGGIADSRDTEPVFGVAIGLRF
ncbi:MAG: hypothetical protein OIF48_07205 [Silicimonas sp.]|nr:hypothetical protein [Silicimonas sp.]